jgi:hypothetical protein
MNTKGRTMRRKLSIEHLENRELLAVVSTVAEFGDPLPQEYVDMATGEEIGPYHGEAIINADGTITYTPDTGYVGFDFFWYTVDDNEGNTSNPALVTIEISDAIAGQDDSYDLDEDDFISVSAPGVLLNDAELTPETVVELTADVSHGTLMLDDDGSFIYVPDENWNGTDQFAYIAIDPVLGTSPISIVHLNVLPVNDDPIVVDDAYDMDEDTVLTVIFPDSFNGSGILANDIDIDGDVKTAVYVSGPNFGDLTLNPDGTFTYVPDLDYNGEDQFAYQVSDGNGGLSDIGIVNLTVNPVNDDPVAVTDEYTTDEDVPLTTSNITGVLSNDTDVDVDVLTVALTSGPEFGSIDFNEDGSFTYIPDANYNGEDTFTYIVDDGNDGTAVGTVNLTITPVNDAPNGVTDLYEAIEDTPLTVVAPGVLLNDTDIEDDVLTAVKDSDPNFGTLVLNDDGSFLYTPNIGYVGWDAFVYHADDGNGGISDPINVNVEVKEGNDDPTPVDDDYVTDEDVQLVGNILDNDSDPNSDPLTVSDYSLPTNGTLGLNSDGSFTYDPNPNFFGDDGFIYTVSDGQGGTATANVDITIIPINDGPEGVSDTYTTLNNVSMSIQKFEGVLANDTDVDGDVLTSVVISDPTEGTLYMNDQGAFIYIPNESYVGQDQFTYEVHDGTEGHQATVIIDITDSQAPVARDNLYVHDVSGSTNYNVPYSVGVLANDYLRIPGDARGSLAGAYDGPLAVVTPLTKDVEHGVLTIQDDGSFEYTPEVGFEGADTFIYRATDGDLETSEATVTIVVRNNPGQASTMDAAVNEVASLDELYEMISDDQSILDEDLLTEAGRTFGWLSPRTAAAFNASVDAEAMSEKKKKERQKLFDAWLQMVDDDFCQIYDYDMA